MLIPHWLYVAVFLILSLLGASVIIYILLKLIPKGRTVLRAFVGMFLFLFAFCAVLLSLAALVPNSNIEIVGNGTHRHMHAVFSQPKEIMEQYGCTEFEMGHRYILNTSDQNMLLFPVHYTYAPAFDKSTSDEGPVMIPAGKFTDLEISGGHMPDFFFEVPDKIKIEYKHGSPRPKNADRWVIDYMKANF